MNPKRLTLAELFPELSLPSPLAEKVPADMTLDSRDVVNGGIFCAVRGSTINREDFMPQAFAAGALLVVKTSETDKAHLELFEGREDRPVISVPDLRKRLGVLASTFFGHPSRALRLVGVTGTNGKTSFVTLLSQCWRALGHRAASLGTLGCQLDHGETIATGMTTADVVENHRLLAQLVKKGVTHVAMEVSSHGVDQGRVAGLAFAAKVITNITRDHLDYHGSMAQYAETKLGFMIEGAPLLVANADDALIANAIPRMQLSGPCSRYAIHAAQAEVRALQCSYSLDGIQARIQGEIHHIQLNTALVGEFNLSNVLAVFAVLEQEVAETSAVQTVLNAIQPVPGRLQRVGDTSVFVDYAHTPDALKNALVALRAHCEGDLIVVFGCGGDRDVGKRPLMGEMASTLADQVIITSDNPRSEPADKILEQIKAGMTADIPVFVEADRREALALGLSLLSTGDVLLVAGKGHEQTQEIAGVKMPFHDASVLAELMAGAHETE